MWIQEGIDTYAEALFFREIAGEKGYDSMVLAFKLSIQNEKPIVQGEGLNSGESYIGDVYSKGAFFMHTLRYVLGDSIFFPTLRKLATDQNIRTIISSPQTMLSNYSAINREKH